MKKNSLFIIVLLFSLSTIAQIIGDNPPYVLTREQVKNWTPTGATASDDLIATQPLLPRFINTDTQFNETLLNDMEIAYLPDGMNNFGNYFGEQNQFNLFTFTNWSYIDKLIWFGGTADLPLLLPSSPWVNTAHKNGVKVLGNLFFAPNAFGGSTANIIDFLEQDVNGDFIVVPIMVEMMQYYNFDGWFVNQETNTNTATGQLVYDFLKALTTAVEALDKEVMWYDAMNLNGTVAWQNRLNQVNSPFVQNDEDGNPGNGFEQRNSSSIFINFFWSGTSGPTQSKQRAQVIERSEFDVFTGVDLWPGRNQGRFETVGNTWMGWIEENSTTSRTSLGLFAPNCVFSNTLYSSFANNPNDYEDFYSEERHMFAGADRNVQLEDATGFKGYTHWLPASSTITELPFETNFNLGHGLSKFEDGVETSNNPWHHINEQDILPNWQFAFSTNDLTGKWDFFEAFNSGSSLKIEGNIPSNGAIDMSLYKTQLPLTTDSKIDIIYNYEGINDLVLSYVLNFVDNPLEDIVLPFTTFNNGDWTGQTLFLNSYSGRTLSKISMRFQSSIAIPDFSLNIGNIKVHNGAALDTNPQSSLSNAIVVIYPNNKEEVVIESKNGMVNNLIHTIYSSDGKLITDYRTHTSINQIVINTSSLSNGVYFIKLKDENGNTTTKKFIVR